LKNKKNQIFQKNQILQKNQFTPLLGEDVSCNHF